MRVGIPLFDSSRTRTCQSANMIDEDYERRDWIFSALVTVLVIAALVWLNRLPKEADAKTSDPENEPTLEYEPQSVIPDAAGAGYQAENTSGYQPNAIARVFECEREGQRVLSDQPCGADAEVREIAAPNRMDRQDTRALYQAPPRSVQVQRMRASQQIPAKNSARCKKIEDDIEAINDRMRREYRSWEGERLRESLRYLSKERHEARCIR
jgi:hypothetical protein